MRNSRRMGFIACLVLVLAGIGLHGQARAVTEPTVHQIYETARRGDVAAARDMVNGVIQRHPESAKAHYVKAELAMRDQDPATARLALRKAEQLAPGLPFVRPEAVADLRRQIDGAASAAAPQEQVDTRSMGGPPAGIDLPAPATAQAAGRSGFSVGTLLLPVLLMVGLAAWSRRKAATRSGGGMAAHPYGRTRLGGPDATHFGRMPQPGPQMPPQAPGPGTGWQGGPGAFPQADPRYSDPRYNDPRDGARGTGLGSALVRGLGTGLAIGAGAAAAHEIGRRMFDQDGHPLTHGAAGAADSQLARDAGLGGVGPDMGGQDFGIQDAGSSWDEAGGGGFGDVGDGGDW